jgi:hypothetical protein
MLILKEKAILIVTQKVINVMFVEFFRKEMFSIFTAKYVIMIFVRNAITQINKQF